MTLIPDTLICIYQCENQKIMLVIRLPLRYVTNIDRGSRKTTILASQVKSTGRAMVLKSYLTLNGIAGINMFTE